jgi:hypothetical protein
MFDEAVPNVTQGCARKTLLLLIGNAGGYTLYWLYGSHFHTKRFVKVSVHFFSVLKLLLLFLC